MTTTTLGTTRSPWRGRAGEAELATWLAVADEVAAALAEDGVGWALDDNNKALITADMKTKVDAARQDIISGKIVVPTKPS